MSSCCPTSTSPTAPRCGWRFVWLALRVAGVACGWRCVWPTGSRWRSSTSWTSSTGYWTRSTCLRSQTRSSPKVPDTLANQSQPITYRTLLAIGTAVAEHLADLHTKARALPPGHQAGQHCLVVVGQHHEQHTGALVGLCDLGVDTLKRIGKAVVGWAGRHKRLCAARNADSAYEHGVLTDDDPEPVNMVQPRMDVASLGKSLAEILFHVQRQPGDDGAHRMLSRLTSRMRRMDLSDRPTVCEVIEELNSTQHLQLDAFASLSRRGPAAIA